MEQYEEIEKSIRTTYRKRIWAQFIRAIKEYKLISEGDKIAVCISGGKDSMLLAKCMQELKRHRKMNFELVFLCMDPGYTAANRGKIEKNSEILNIPLTIFETPIFESVANVDEHPCYLCARMRRGYLYKKAQSLGCNKIALGHHFDDVIETILMGMFYGSQMQTMMPKVCSTSHPGMELIRPLCYVKEADIVAWKNRHNLEFLQCACRFTEDCANQVMESKRQEVKELINELRKKYAKIDMNIYRSAENVNLDTVISYRKGKEIHHFMDEYDEKLARFKDENNKNR